MNELFCRPKWYAENVTYPDGLNKYKAIQIPKDGQEAEEIFDPTYLEHLPEGYVWKIITHREPVYRSQEDFSEQFDIVRD